MAGTGWIAFVDRVRWEGAWQLFHQVLVQKRRDQAARIGRADLAELLLAADIEHCGARQDEVLVAPSLCPGGERGPCRGPAGCAFATLRGPAVDNPLARAFVHHLGTVTPAASLPANAIRDYGRALLEELRRSAEALGELEWPALVSARPACYLCRTLHPRGTVTCPAGHGALDPQDQWDREAWGAPLRKLLFVAPDETMAGLEMPLQRFTAQLLRVQLRGTPFGTFAGGPTQVFLPVEAAAACRSLDEAPLPEPVRAFGYQMRAWLWAAAQRQAALVVVDRGAGA